MHVRLLPLIALLALTLLPIARAEAAVAFRAATCGQSSSVTTITLAVPAGTQPGDLIVASVGFANSATVATPSGWTQVPNLRGTVHSEQELVTWYRFASAPIPASYTFTSGAGTDAISGGLTSWSGVSTTTPIAGTPAQTIQSSITSSDTLPNSNGTQAGSVRYSAVTADDLSSSTYPSMSMVCDEPNGTGVDVATSIAWEATGAGTTATRTVNRSDNARSVLQTMVINPPACGSGTLGWTPPTAIAFPSTALTGLDQTRPATTTFRVDDQSSVHDGWSISGTSTLFTNGAGHTLPAGATRITGMSAATVTGNCAMPTNAVGYPVTLPAAASAPTAAKLYNAADETGMGPVDLTMAASLSIPAHARVGNYSSTWTLTLATGP